MQQAAHSVMPATSARRDNFKKGCSQMKTRIGNMQTMIHGPKIMREGMMIAEAMLTEGPNHLAKDAKKVTARSETEKSH